MTWPLRLMLLAVAATTILGDCPSSDWKEYQGMCYWRSDFTVTWQEAKEVCQSLAGSDLVSIHDDVVNVFVAEDIMSGDHGWLGLRRAEGSSVWLWTDGSLVDYLNWYGSSPSGEGCAVINYSSYTGYWHSYSCDGYNFYIVCQAEAS